MSLNLTEFSWWHVAKAHEIDKSAFNATAWSLATFWSELTQRNRYYLALVDEKKEIVGFGGVAFNGVDADIQTIAIGAENQGGGLGGQLLDSMLDAAEALSVRFIFLEVRADNYPAINLYASRHFNRMSERVKYYPDGETAIIMRRDSRQNVAEVQR